MHHLFFEWFDRSVPMLSVFLKGLMMKSFNVTFSNWFKPFDLSVLINLVFLISLCNDVCFLLHTSKSSTSVLLEEGGWWGESLLLVELCFTILILCSITQYRVGQLSSLVCCSRAA